MRRGCVLAAVGACVAPAAQAPNRAAPARPPAAVASPLPALPPAAAPQPVPSEGEVEALLALDCAACHSLDYVRQQRMTATQWTATLTKMRHWGALLGERQVGPLAASLAARHGPGTPLAQPRLEDVRAFVPPSASSQSKAAQTRGRALFAARCAACHGQDARGGIGVNLGDEQLLQEPALFSATVRAGRGRMPPHPDLSDAQIRDLLAWLRTL